MEWTPEDRREVEARYRDVYLRKILQPSCGDTTNVPPLLSGSICRAMTNGSHRRGFGVLRE